MPGAVDAGLAAAGVSGEWSPDGPQAYCPRCGASAGPGAVTPRGCAFCLDKNLPWDRLTRLSAYAEPMDGWIKAMKFGAQWDWGRFFGKHLAEAMGEPFDTQKVVVCPVPMPWLRRWGRGFNQAKLIAEALAKAKGLPCIELLKRTRHTAPQTTVAPSQRPANVRGSLAMRDIDLTGYEIWLIDDIKTTGSTLEACTKLLRKAGAKTIHAAVAAVADPKGQNFRTV